MLLSRLVKNITHTSKTEGISDQATVLAYVTLLSLIPALGILFILLASLSPFFNPNGQILELIKELIVNNLAKGTGEEALEYLKKTLISLDVKKLGIMSIGSMTLTLALLLRKIELALNQIWGVAKPRSLLLRTGSFLFFALVMFAALGIGYQALEMIFYSMAIDSEHLPHLSSLSMATALPFVLCFGLYRFVPNCPVSLCAAFQGAVFTAICFQSGAWVFVRYINNVSDYQIYGALSLVPVFLLWLYGCWFLILFGGIVTKCWDQERGMD